MINLMNVKCLKLKSNSGRVLKDNQLQYIANEHHLPMEFLLNMRSENFSKIFFEISFQSNYIEIKLIGYESNNTFHLLEKYKKIPEILKAQISIIETIPIPKETVNPNYLNKKKDKTEKKSINEDKKLLDLDDVLDKIQEKGIESLSKKELEFLNSFSDKKVEHVNFKNPRTRKLSEIFSEDNKTESWFNVIYNFNNEKSRMPEIDELEAMYEQLHKKGLGNFKDDIYWSGTSLNEDAAWYFDFKKGCDGTMLKNLFANIRLIKVEIT
jgi:hypothetical protein